LASRALDASGTIAIVSGAWWSRRMLWPRYRRALAGETLPAAFVDLDAFDANVDRLLLPRALRKSACAWRRSRCAVRR